MDNYIARKIVHMNRMGVPASQGIYGGACPNWLTEQRKEEAKRASKSLRCNLDTTGLILDAIAHAQEQQ